MQIRPNIRSLRTMSDEQSFDASIHSAHVVVHPVVSENVERPFRRVDMLGTQVGKAFTAADVVEFMRRAGLENVDVDDPEIVRWEGGGSDVWE